MTNHTLISNISYKSAPDLSPFEKSACLLDLALPQNTTNFPTVLWFHGGGLTGGDKIDVGLNTISKNLTANGIALASANYRLAPKAQYPDYLHDAAHAFLWLKQNIASYSGNPNSLFVSGHSAGAYLASMLVMDPKVLAHVGLSPDHIKAAIPISAQVSTHLTIKAQRNVPNPLFTPWIDADAPLFHVRQHTQPQLYIIGDNDYRGRLEETNYFLAMLKLTGNTVTQQLTVPNRTHGSIATKMANPEDPAMSAFLKFLQSHA
jgi:dipeptidyl aminopeptidase/acylaminoacyl peptidase